MASAWDFRMDKVRQIGRGLGDNTVRRDRVGHASELLQVSGHISVYTQAVGMCASSLSTLIFF